MLNYVRNQQGWEKFQSLFSSQRKVVIGIFFLVALALPTTLITLHNRTNTTQHASGQTSDIAIDFGSRQNKAHPINMQFGISGVGLDNLIKNNAPIASTLQPANLTLNSYIVNMQTIFANPKSSTNAASQDWYKFDEIVRYSQNSMGNIHLLLQGVPVWLQPQTYGQPNYCILAQQQNNPLIANQQYPEHAFPTHPNGSSDDGLQQYAQLNAIVVAHVDKAFPSIHASYELWNEPDGFNAFCYDHSNMSSQAQLDLNYKNYTAIYAASAPLMKKQGQIDQVTVPIGGPSMTHGNIDNWMPKFLSDASVYPYVDYVVYHKYTDAGRYAQTHGADPTWDQIVAATQDMSKGYGFAAIYEKVEQYIRAGKQPGGASTPVFQGEYNCDTLCRTNPLNAPLWNTLLISDFLNSVNDTSSQYGAAQQVPAGAAMWAWSNTSSGIAMCMFGTIDSSFDCSETPGPIQPYPQYYPYLLFGSPSYLNIRDGSYVVNSAMSNISGVYTTGFYTNKLNNVVIINTTGTDYPVMNVLLQNPGSIGSQANLYTLNYVQNPAQPISTSQVGLTANGSNANALVHVLPYSTVALSMNATGNGTTQTATMMATPSTEGVSLGASFSVDVNVDGGGQAFNAAQATVTVSPNLLITSLAAPASNACGFTYTQTPTVSNPSFAGAIPSTSSQHCTVYTLTVKAITNGTGTITFTNGSVKSYANNSEILQSVTNGTYTVVTPTFTPAPTVTPTPSITPTPQPTFSPTPTMTPMPTYTPTPTMTSAPTPSDTPVPLILPTVTTPINTYQSLVTLNGTKDPTETTIVINNNSTLATYPTSTTWQATVVVYPYPQQSTYTIYATDGTGNQSGQITATVIQNKLGDINGDGVIDFTDLSLFGVDWGKSSNLTYPLSDMNNDGTVDLTDLSILAKQFGQ